MDSKKLIDEVLDASRRIKSAEELEIFYNKMFVISIAVLRGFHDEAFIKAYLTSAINEENPIIIKPVRMQ